MRIELTIDVDDKNIHPSEVLDKLRRVIFDMPEQDRIDAASAWHPDGDPKVKVSIRRDDFIKGVNPFFY